VASAAYVEIVGDGPADEGERAVGRAAVSLDVDRLEADYMAAGDCCEQVSKRSTKGCLVEVMGKRVDHDRTDMALIADFQGAWVAVLACGHILLLE